MTNRKNSPVPTQVDKFRDMARKLECDDDDAAFAERVKRMATAPRRQQAPKERPS
jgi:hypothetical protein